MPWETPSSAEDEAAKEKEAHHAKLEARIAVQEHLALTSEQYNGSPDDKVYQWGLDNAELFGKLWADTEFQNFVMDHWKDQDQLWLRQVVEIWAGFAKEQIAAKEATIKAQREAEDYRRQKAARPNEW